MLIITNIIDYILLLFNMKYSMLIILYLVTDLYIISVYSVKYLMPGRYHTPYHRYQYPRWVAHEFFAGNKNRSYISRRYVVGLLKFKVAIHFIVPFWLTVQCVFTIFIARRFAISFTFQVTNNTHRCLQYSMINLGEEHQII